MTGTTAPSSGAILDRLDTIEQTLRSERLFDRLNSLEDRIGDLTAQLRNDLMDVQRTLLSQGSTPPN